MENLQVHNIHHKGVFIPFYKKEEVDKVIDEKDKQIKNLLELVDEQNIIMIDRLKLIDKPKVTKKHSKQ